MTATATTQQDTPPQAGDAAPDFTLPTTAGRKLTLSALRGTPVLLAFFPLAFSDTCTAELCEMRDDWSAFTRRGVTVLPISVDSTYALEAYRKELGMDVEMVSDFFREASRRFGVYLPARNYSNRAYFLVDAEGIVRWSHVEVNPGQRRSNAEILAEVDKLA